MLNRCVVAVLAIAACRPPGRVATITSACLLARAPREHADTLRIILPQAVDPVHAPLGTNEAERLVFAQLYEKLLRRDCAGVLAPGLAEDWRRMGDTAWRLRLRPGARFSDATIATGSAVAAVLAGAVPHWRLAALGDRDLVVHARGDERLPGVLAEGRLAIAKGGIPGQWPASTLGTITAAPQGITFTRGEVVMAFTWPAGADARDLLEGGADAVLTDQPAALEYAAGRGAFDAIPLPWGRTYVVVVPPGRDASFANGAGSWRDAVRGEARPAMAPFWWTTAACAGPRPASVAATGSPRVVYAFGDAHAQALAERLVARGLARAVALAPDELRTAIAAGGDFAVVALPRSPAHGCATLAAHGLAGVAAAQIIPLLDTRLQLVVRSGRFGVSLDGDGTPRLDP